MINIVRPDERNWLSSTVIRSVFLLSSLSILFSICSPSHSPRNHEQRSILRRKLISIFAITRESRSSLKAFESPCHTSNASLDLPEFLPFMSLSFARICVASLWQHQSLFVGKRRGKKSDKLRIKMLINHTTFTWCLFWDGRQINVCLVLFSVACRFLFLLSTVTQIPAAKLPHRSSSSALYWKLIALEI